MPHLSKNLAQQGARAALREEFQPLENMGINSIDRTLIDGIGLTVYKELTLTNNGATDVNCFTVAGDVAVQWIYLKCTAQNEGGGNTTFDAVNFNIWDGAAGDDITLAAGVNASGIVVGGKIIKTNTAANAAVFVNGDQARVTEGAVGSMLMPFFASQKGDGTTTYIRLGYTGDATTDLEVTVILKYNPWYLEGIVTAV